MKWSELIGEATKKVLIALAKLVVFIFWLVCSALQIFLREVVTAMRGFLFPNKK